MAVVVKGEVSGGLGVGGVGGCRVGGSNGGHHPHDRKAMFRLA